MKKHIALLLVLALALPLAACGGPILKPSGGAPSIPTTTIPTTTIPQSTDGEIDTDDSGNSDGGILESIFSGLGKFSSFLDVDKSVETVIAAFKTRDIDAIEALMCKNIKDNTPNLRGEIGKLIDLIQGKITSTSSESTNDFSVSSGGKNIEQASSYSIINTAIAKYIINITWEYYNNFSLGQRGIRYIGVSLIANDDYEILGEIMATEGIYSTHD